MDVGPLHAQAREASRRRGGVVRMEWRPHAVYESVTPSEEDTHQLATGDWCHRLWPRATPTALQYALVDYLLHGQPCPQTTGDHMSSVMEAVREVAIAALPVPSTEAGLADAVAALVETVERLAHPPTPTWKPPTQRARVADRRLRGFHTRPSQPHGMGGTRVAPVMARSDAWKAVRSARLHTLAPPSGGRSVPGGGAAWDQRQVAEQWEAVCAPLRG